MDRALIIGVCGGSGSGKTFFAQALQKKLGNKMSSIVYQDNYYKDQSDKFDYDGGSVNFDCPTSLDFVLMANQLERLKKFTAIQMPNYDFKTHSRLESCVEVQPKKVIIVDGILVLTQPKLREIFDLSIFVETPEAIRFERRLLRDVETRGRTPEGVKNQFFSQVKPMHDKYVEPSKEFADIISSGTDMEKFYQVLNWVTRSSLNSSFEETFSFSDTSLSFS